MNLTIARDSLDRWKNSIGQVVIMDRWPDSTERFMLSARNGWSREQLAELAAAIMTVLAGTEEGIALFAEITKIQARLSGE